MFSGSYLALYNNPCIDIVLPSPTTVSEIQLMTTVKYTIHLPRDPHSGTYGRCLWFFLFFLYEPPYPPPPPPLPNVIPYLQHHYLPRRTGIGYRSLKRSRRPWPTWLWTSRPRQIKSAGSGGLQLRSAMTARSYLCSWRDMQTVTGRLGAYTREYCPPGSI